MKLGFAAPVSGSWATPENQVRLAQRAEELGYHSIWTFQRLLYPADDTGRRAEPYRSVLDPTVTLAFLAGQTSRVRLGVAVLNMPFLSPTMLAKQLASLDIVSGGRLDAGLGLGSSPDEYVATGAPSDRRGRRADEYLQVLKTLWTEDVVAFDGEFCTVPRARMEPKPIQKPHPPILLGGSAEPALRRVGRLADGWISSSHANLDRVADAIAVIKDAARGAGRDPEALRFISRGPVRVRPGGDPERRRLTGSLEEIRGDLAFLREQGVGEVFIDLNFDPEIGSPDADPAESLRRAEEVLVALKP